MTKRDPTGAEIPESGYNDLPSSVKIERDDIFEIEDRQSGGESNSSLKFDLRICLKKCDV